MKNAAAMNAQDLADVLPGLLERGGTLGELTGIDAPSQEAVYASAYGLYEQERYGDALSLFAFLAFNDHFEPRFLWGMGACAQQLGRYQEAMRSYLLLTAMNMVDPMPTFRVAECMVGLGQKSEAIETLGIVMELADGDEQASLRKRAAAMLDLLKKEAS